MIVTRVLALLLALTVSGAGAADARQPRGGHPGGGPPAGGGPGRVGGGGAPRAPGPEQPVSRPAPAQPAPRGGFNLGRDTGPMSPAQAGPRAAPSTPRMPSMVNASTGGSRQAAPGAYRSLAGGVRPPTSGGRPPAPPSGGWRRHPSGFVVANPRYHGDAWAWNAGSPWIGYSNYWGDGFWGPFALGSLTGLYDAQTQELPYYQVAAASPGAQLLANYNLVQTPCGSSDLVVLYGPNDGTICAYPNALVAPGDYTIDESSLSITSSSS